MANSPSLMSSTVNVANFVSVRPWLKDRDRSNYDYAIWREQMLCLLDSQGLLRFIDDGRQPSVPEQSPEEQEIWRRTDRLIKGWILGSLGNDAVAAVAGLNSSREVWLELQNIFNQVLQDNNNVQIQIQNQIPDSSTSKRVEDQGEAAAAGGIRNAPVELELASQTPNHVPQQNNIGARKNYTKYLALRRAITRADWVEAGRLLDTDEGARTTIISEIDETALLLAVAVGKTSNDFVRGLIGSMPVDTLAIQNSYGNTVLHRAAMIGNKEIADLLLARNPELLYIQNKQDYLPVHIAAIFCHKSMLERLIDIHEKHAEDRPSVGQISIHERNIDKSPFIGQLGASLLSGTIISQFIDVALYLVRKYPELATLKNQFGIDALFELARSGSVFGSGAKFCWWRKLIYSGIILTSTTNDIGNLRSNDEATKKFSWFGIIYKIPFVKRIKKKKVMHQQAIELVRCLCKALESFPSSEASTIYEKALFLAVHNDIFEVVEVILEMFPTAINAIDTKTEATIFHVAARERSETVFNLLQMKEGKHFLYNYVDSSGNNYMHMCGEQAPTHKLNLVSGAALQMQRELQWFKEMENFVTPSRRTMQNNEGKTPKMLFTEKHQELKSQGEKWMKDTATSCSIAAALIATVVFAAAFTVPGGFSNNGIPVFVKRKLFITFALSDSVSLFSSATSLLMFLSILTSRYAEEDFLYLLPTRLCIGLLTLFTSIIFMVVAFSITIYITVQENSNLFLIPIVILACFPVASFMLLQFPLLIDAVYSTYGPGIFGKKKSGTLY